jgi:hypothetical protein
VIFVNSPKGFRGENQRSPDYKRGFIPLDLVRNKLSKEWTRNEKCDESKDQIVQAQRDPIVQIQEMKIPL